MGVEVLIETALSAFLINDEQNSPCPSSFLTLIDAAFHIFGHFIQGKLKGVDFSISPLSFFVLSLKPINANPCYFLFALYVSFKAFLGIALTFSGI